MVLATFKFILFCFRRADVNTSEMKKINEKGGVAYGDFA